MEFLLALNTGESSLYIILRSICIYGFGVILFRFGNTRFRLQAPFDFVLIMMLGAIFGKTIFDGPLFEAILVSLLLIIIHQVFAKLSYKYPRFSYIVKGKPKLLLKDGKINWNEMRKHGISQSDLIEICHKEFKADNLSDIKQAILERSGEITFIKN